MKFDLQSLKDGWNKFVENHIIADMPPELDIEANYGWTIYQINSVTGHHPEYIKEKLEQITAFDDKLNIDAQSRSEFNELIERYCAHTGVGKVPFHVILNTPSHD